MNLDIGCGDNPVWDLPGEWHRLDARPLPGLTYCQDAADLSNIPADTYELIVARDVIEHIGWRDTSKALAEWRRVLKPGGRIHIETPNAWELVGILHESPAAMAVRVQRESHFEQFNRTLFGHQDYPENSHKSYFTPRWLKGLMFSVGFSQVSTLVEDDRRFVLEGIK